MNRDKFELNLCVGCNTMKYVVEGEICDRCKDIEQHKTFHKIAEKSKWYGFKKILKGEKK